MNGINHLDHRTLQTAQAHVEVGQLFSGIFAGQTGVEICVRQELISIEWNHRDKAESGAGVSLLPTRIAGHQSNSGAAT